MSRMLTGLLIVLVSSTASAQARFVSADLSKLRSVSDVELSPDGSKVAYVVENNDAPGRPYGQLWVMAIDTRRAVRFGGEHDPSGLPVWSPDGQSIAYRGRSGEKSGLMVARADGTGARFLAEMSGTNSPLPSTGATISWSPDGTRIAFVSSVPGPETAAATGDPMVITRYLYKPTAGEGMTRFNDNRRLHLFIVDLGSGRVDQLTDGTHYEHSIAWSPKGDEIAFVSNREANEDQFFNYDLFVLKVADKSIRRLTSTENAEYRPSWSPDGKVIAYQGTKRGLTDLETTMEDTHIWAINADGTDRRELDPRLDNRQGEVKWSPEGDALYFTVQEQGNVRLYRMDPRGGPAKAMIHEPGTVTAWSVGRGGRILCAYASPSAPAELYLQPTAGGWTRLTDLNHDVLAGKTLGEVEAFTFVSNDNKYQVQAFLTRPADFDPARKYPMVVVIHGGPHGQQGPAFNFKNQVYASQGYATLMVNYRGSTGYGQAFTDAVFGDQNGNEAQDVLYGVSAALRRHEWIDRDRLGIEGGSYGGQLSAWLITQTNMFKAAIPTAAIINLISYNYMTYYNQYEQMEWGVFPHQGDLMDTLLQRSALRHVANAHTPTMLLHGENDNDVPIAEAEQYYIALRDVGTEAVMVRYPREGHGLRETKHVIDAIDRSIAWYEKHFPRPKS